LIFEHVKNKKNGLSLYFFHKVSEVPDSRSRWATAQFASCLILKQGKWSLVIAWWWYRDSGVVR